jgi:glycosyltransferase involved in cell wall biosynthesis
MKIAVFHNVPAGGAKRAVYEEVKYLSKKHDIDIYRYSSTDESFLDIRPFAKNVYTYDFDIDSNKSGFLARLERDYKNFVVLRGLSEKIAKDLDSRGYDVVLTHPNRFTQAPFVNRLTKTPTLYFCEEYLRMVYEDQFEFKKTGNTLKDYYELLTRKIRKAIDKKNAQGADLVVGNSKFTKRNIEKAFGIKAQYCYLGADTKVFKPIEKKTNKKYVLFVGDKNDELGYGLAKKALKRVQKNIDLVNLGFSEGSKNIENDKGMAIEYTSALFTLCTHQNEPFGIPPLESMACETPVLAVNEGGYKETVVEGVTGYLLPRDPKAFAKKIIYLIDNPSIAKKMGRAGREHVKKNFTWEKHNKKLEKMLVKLTRTY